MNYKQRPRDAESLLFEKVKEVTGVNDDMVIRRACEACQDSNGKVKVEDVVTVLLNDDSVHTKTKVILYVSLCWLWVSPIYPTNGVSWFKQYLFSNQYHSCKF